VQQQQQQRQRHLQEACSASNDTWSQPWKFIVSHDLRLVYCVVGKVAYTSWMRVLLQLTGNPAAQHLATADRETVHFGKHNYHLDIASFPNATQLASSPFKDYYKFMFVREPLERLVSAYRDKMFRANEYAPLRQYIISLFRRHSSSR